MPNMMKVTTSLLYGQVRLEIEITSEDGESLTVNEIKGHIDWLISEGFQPAVYGGNRVDLTGKKGTVVSIKPIEGTKMYEVIGKLDDDTEFKWREFNAHSFRKNDRFQVVKNDRGFKQGELILDDLEQQELDL